MLEEAVHRKIEKELGIVFKVQPEDLDIKLDEQSEDWGIFDKLPESLVIKPFST